jgi:hypothetical protein
VFTERQFDFTILRPIDVIGFEGFVDEDDRPLPAGEVGAIRVRAPRP